MSISSETAAFLKSQGADFVGFADLRELPRQARDNFPRGVSIAVALSPQILAEIEEGPTRAYYAEYRRINRLLNLLGRRTVRFLEERGHKAQRFAATNAGINSKTLSTQLPHKTIATRAGLGWIGKCALLVTKEYGSAVRLTTVLTDAELETGRPVNKSRCGECSACVDACPGHAPSGRNWKLGLYRDSFFDPWHCRKAARKLARERAGIRETICGICIAACPLTERYRERRS